MDICKDFVINEFEKKSGALVDYLNNLEACYERLRLEFERFRLDSEHRESQLKREKAELKYMLESALERDRKLEHDKCLLLKEKERLLDRIQDLECKINELQREMQRKEELYNCRRKRDERARRKLDIENKALKKKATVGWMLGSLCEVYLEGGADGGTLPLILMLRKLQKDLERETVSCDIKVSTDSLKREVNKLLRSTSGSRSPRVEVRIQDSRPGSRAGSEDGDESRRKPYRSVSPKGRSTSCTRSPFCPRPPSPFSQRTRSPISPRSPVSPRDKSPPMSPRDQSPLSPRARSPYSPARHRSPSRSPSPVSRCSKTKSRSPSPCTTLTVNFDDMPEVGAGHFHHHHHNHRHHLHGGGGGHVDTVEIRSDGRKRAEIKVADEGGTDIKHMLSNIEANINYLLDSERKRRWRESQFRNLGAYSPRSRTRRGT